MNNPPTPPASNTSSPPFTTGDSHSSPQLNPKQPSHPPHPPNPKNPRLPSKPRRSPHKNPCLSSQPITTTTTTTSPDTTTQIPTRTTTTTRIRDNQRRSRARRKAYLSELEAKVRNFERRGVEASAEVQAAARDVVERNRVLERENGRLRGVEKENERLRVLLGEGYEQEVGGRKKMAEREGCERYEASCETEKPCSGSAGRKTCGGERNEGVCLSLIHI